MPDDDLSGDKLIDMAVARLPAFYGRKLRALIGPLRILVAASHFRGKMKAPIHFGSSSRRIEQEEPLEETMPDVYNWEAVYGPAPVSENYHGEGYPAAWQAARDRYAAMRDEFVGVKAKVFDDGSVYAVGAVGPKQRIQLESAAIIARKLGSNGLVIERRPNQGGFRFWLVLDRVQVIGGSEGEPLKETRPWMLPLDGAFETPESALAIALKNAAQIIEHGGVLFLADDGQLPVDIAKKNRKRMKEILTEDGADIGALPNL